MTDIIERVSLQDQIAEVKREILLRQQVYTRMVDQLKMTSAEAEKRTVTMVAVLRTLEQLREIRNTMSTPEP
jgi:hypothetical protein